VTRAASPEALDLLWADIVRWMAEDLETYGHVHGAGYEGRRGGSKRAATKCGQCGGVGWVAAEPQWVRCEECGTPPSDPTGEIVVGGVAVRGQCGEFSERVLRMWMVAKGNRRVLRTAEDVLDRGADMETTGAALRRAERVTAGELAGARSAKARRVSRGERLPGALPRGWVA
jgi:ribosomal protein S27E